MVSSPTLDPDPPGRLAFLAPTWSPGDGFASADAHCQTAADAAGLSGTYLALLAGDTTSAASRFDLSGPTWYRVDGALLARTPAALMAARLETSMMIDASGAPASARLMWTGYAAEPDLDGNAIGTHTCMDWNITGQLAATGDPRAAGPAFFDAGSRSDCGGGSAIACLQQ